MKTFTSAPLPFMGQKRNFVKTYRNLLQSLPNDAIFVDLFGGSGLLSHTTRRAKPTAKVVYNDFDNYSRRLGHIPATNALLARIRPLVAHVPKHHRLSAATHRAIVDIVRQADEQGFVDYITLSSSLLFSSKYATSLDELQRSQFYNNVRQGDYDAAGYLDGLTITSCDYRELFNQYCDDERVIFLIDPPYLSTEVGTYNMSWSLSDYLDVLQVLRGHRYVYFTSAKSQIVELCEWMGRNQALGNPCLGATRHEFQATLNYNSSYTDIMLHNVG